MLTICPLCGDPLAICEKNVNCKECNANAKKRGATKSCPGCECNIDYILAYFIKEYYRLSEEFEVLQTERKLEE